MENNVNPDKKYVGLYLLLQHTEKTYIQSPSLQSYHERKDKTVCCSSSGFCINALLYVFILVDLIYPYSFYSHFLIVNFQTAIQSDDLFEFGTHVKLSCGHPSKLPLIHIYLNVSSLEQELATCSSILPKKFQSGGLQFMRSQGVRHD